MKQHEQFDKFTDEWLTMYQATGRNIYCRKGCAGCCHLAVHATWPEASAAAAGLAAQQASKLDGYVARLKEALPNITSMRGYLRVHRQELGPCPFLDDAGSCSIYLARPLSCRALLSTRPAAWCTVDFSELGPWDKQAYESSLDRQVVAWPTHYVAATQDFGRALESDLLAAMRRKNGWAMAGNFALMVWLRQNNLLDEEKLTDTHMVHDLLAAAKLDSSLLLDLTASDRKGCEAAET